MCQYLVKLAGIDRWHFIMCCEHGNMHLQWGKVRFTFTYREMVHLLVVLETEQYDASEHIEGVRGHHHRLDNKCFRINIDAVALTLSTHDLTSLIEAIHVTITRLEAIGNPAEYALHIHRKRLFAPSRNYNCTFSVN